MRTPDNCETPVRAKTRLQRASIPRVPRALGALVLAVAASACGASNPGQSARGTPDLSKALPAPTSSPFGLARGDRPLGITGQRLGSSADLEAYLKRGAATPEAAAVATSSPRPARPERARPSALALPDTRVPANAAPAPAGDFGAASVAVQHATARPPSAVSDSQLYAQRQNKSRSLERYRGGDVVVIGVSTLVIVLLIVLLIVLIL
jgi:hypothetical protein